jgi:hypothetical protein
VASNRKGERLYRFGSVMTKSVLTYKFEGAICTTAGQVTLVDSEGGTCNVGTLAVGDVYRDYDIVGFTTSDTGVMQGLY